MGKTIPMDLDDPQVKLQKGRSFSCSTTWQGVYTFQLSCCHYSLTFAFSGSNFFDGWDFFYWPDPTNGMVNYQGGGDAWGKNLISISDQGTACV